MTCLPTSSHLCTSIIVTTSFRLIVIYLALAIRQTRDDVLLNTHTTEENRPPSADMATKNEKIPGGRHNENCNDIEEEHNPYDTLEVSPALDRRITRKFDTHIVPWLFGLWLLAFIDRSNIGNARIDGLATDLRLTGNKFNITLTVFYVSYVLIDVPSNWLLKWIGAGYYLPGLMVGWGIVGTCIGSVKSYSGLIAARFFLGLCEGGLLGGMVLYLSMFYRRHELLFRLGMFYCAAPLSGAFGGLLATGLAEINFHGYNRWPWIFFVEGAITILFGILTIFFLPHTPMQAKYLTDDERYAAVSRMKLDAHGASNKSNVESESFKWQWARMAVLNWNTYVWSRMISRQSFPESQSIYVAHSQFASYPKDSQKGRLLTSRST